MHAESAVYHNYLEIQKVLIPTLLFHNYGNTDNKLEVESLICSKVMSHANNSLLRTDFQSPFVNICGSHNS